MYETEARHCLREVLMAAIHRADEGCADWRIADALLDAGEITWNYQILPEPQLATFQLIITATDAEPASGGVVEPSPLTAEETTADCLMPPKSPADVAAKVRSAYGMPAEDARRIDGVKVIGDLRDRLRPHAALNERGHLRGCGCEDCERAEQGEGGVR